MKYSEFSDIERGITDADLEDVERSLGFTFPQEVRHHYLQYNGGSPTRYLFKKGDMVYVVHQFLPIKYGKHRFEESFYNLKIKAEILPKHLIPFAVDPGGDYYCFSVRKDDNGSVWIYRGDYSDNPDKAVEFLAGSFNQFLESMETDES
jgi:cell wall assembly regulator SMI1